MNALFFIAFVRPICLPYEDDAEEDYHTSNVMKSHAFWVAGWGATTKRGLYHNKLFDVGR